jgi:hypothetical protein
MLSFGQVARLAWTVVGFMLTAALVLNLRYKPVAGGSAYLDTWTGNIQSLTAQVHDPTVLTLETPRSVVLGRSGGERVIRIEELRSRVERGVCAGVRHAFPAPGSSVTR